MKHLLFILFLNTLGFSASAQEITSVTPTGSVKDLKQIVVKFSTEMVAMGDPRSKKDPLKLSCKKNAADSASAYSSRWADNKTWVVDFAESQSAGVSCTLNYDGTARDLAGKAVAGLMEYHVQTGGPSIKGFQPSYEIEPDQYFVFNTDGLINVSSMEQLAYFEVKDFPDKVPVQIITGKDRETVITGAIESTWKWKPYKKLLETKKFSEIPDLENFFVIKAKRRFPEGASVVFHWPKGILSASGLPVQEPQSYKLTVIPSFKATFSCERPAPDRNCNPILNMSLGFSRRVNTDLLDGTKLIAENGTTWLPEQLTKNKRTKIQSLLRKAIRFMGWTNKEEEFVDSLTFKGPFPGLTKFKIHLPRGVKDDIGRPLTNADKYPLEVSTEDDLPLVKFAAPFGILELKADPALPVSLRNVEKQLPGQTFSVTGTSTRLNKIANAGDIIQWYSNVIDKDRNHLQRNTPLLKNTSGETFELPKRDNEKSLDLVGIPFKKSGFYVVELASPRLGATLTKGGSMYVASAVLVTDLAVHLKKGRESSLVWVTRLSDGKPVANAKVAITNFQGGELAKGTTNKDGVFTTHEALTPCGDGDHYGNQCHVYAFAESGDDLSFVSSDWDKGLESYRFNVSLEYLRKNWGPVVSHTILDRNLAQRGNAVQMKHIVRTHHTEGFGRLGKEYLPKQVLIRHAGSDKIFALPFSYDEKTGSALNRFEIPKDAPLGEYGIYLSNRDKSKGDSFDWSAQSSGQFTVSEYRLPLMKAQVKLQNGPLVQPKETSVDVSAQYIAGGPARNLKIKTRAFLEPSYPSFNLNQNYEFFGRPVEEDSDYSESKDPRSKYIDMQTLELNGEGGARFVVKNLPALTTPSSLNVEMEYTDPNGEIRTDAGRVVILPSSYAIGFRREGYAGVQDKVKIEGIIVTADGKPAPNREFKVKAYKQTYISHRKRLLGGFYSYESRYQRDDLGNVCSGKSGNDGKFICQPKKLPVGEAILLGEVKDDQGRSSYARYGMSIYEKDADLWWSQGDSDRIDVISDKKHYALGETAKLEVRTPFSESTALVTVEREGVLDYYVHHLKRDQPVVELPIKNSYGPNIFISTVLIRGRIADPKPTALVDLAKPSLKIGLVEVQVGWDAHKLNVDITTPKKRFNVRETVEASIKITPPANLKLEEGAEIALAVVDESLLRLKENKSWDLLAKMMDPRPLAVATSSGQNQVIGKRHFGAKAKPPGGGGGLGAGEVRQFFEPVLAWFPNVKINSNGEAKVNFALNDSITSFRIVAVATSGLDLFGTGKANIESTKDLLIYSGFAPLARDGDLVKNSFTLRNTTQASMKITATVSAEGIASLPEIPEFDLGPGEAKTLTVPLLVPDNIKKLPIKITAKDKVTGAVDQLAMDVKVEESIPAQVLQATLFQLENQNQISVQQPADAIPGRGGLTVDVGRSLASGLGGVRSYMENYPYTCLEQQVSSAVVLEDKQALNRLVTELPSYLDSDGLLKFFPPSACGSAPLTRYILSILHENSVTISEPTQSKLLKGLSDSVEGRTICKSWWNETVKDPYQQEAKILGMEALSRFKAFRPSMLSTVQITPNLWQTETLAAWIQLLHRETQIPNQATALVAATNVLKSRLDFQGSLMNLQQTPDWLAQWLLFTSKDQEALAVLGVALVDNNWKDDVGRMARGLTARLQRGHWDTTTANAWGITLFRKFSRSFESIKPEGQTTIEAPGVSSVVNWQSHPDGAKNNLPWPKGSDTATTAVTFKQLGAGKPWVNLQTLAAIPLKKPLDFGYQISKKLSPVTQIKKNVWSVGDVVNVELTLKATTDQAWVVLRDPIPGSAAHLGTGLEGTSKILDKPSANDDASWPTEYDEKSFSHYTTYAAYLPKGTYSTSYRVRLNAAGDFKMPPTRVEAMYAPENFGESPNDVWHVEP